nr:mat1b [Erythrotrichia welwitschii]
MKSIIYDINLSQFTTRLYVATFVLEKGSLNTDMLLHILSTKQDFSKYILDSLIGDGGKDSVSLFPNLDTSKPKLDTRGLGQFLSHVLVLEFEKNVYCNNDYGKGFSFYRYQDSVLCLSDNLRGLHDFFSSTACFLSLMGLTYNKKKTRILTKQQSFRFLGFEIIPKFLVIKDEVYSQAYINASKEQRKLVLAKARYILRSKRKDGTTRAKTNMPLSKAIVLINPLVNNWRNYYSNLVPRTTQEHLDWLMNEKVYRWYVKRLKKNRVTHWNKKCTHIVKNKKRIAQDGCMLELFNNSNT